MSPILAAICGVMVAAALRELWAESGSDLRARVWREWRRALARSGRVQGGGGSEPASARRLRQAGLEGRLAPRHLAALRLGCGAAALPLALVLASAAPGRSGALVMIALAAAAGALPDLAVESLARRRLRSIGVALPAALELMATSAGSGGTAADLIGAAAGSGRGPLQDELLRAAAELECGETAARSLGRLGERCGSPTAAAVGLLDRSRRLGSPLASGLQEQAALLREQQARRIEEDAARAAPKIQLVVALLLVPSVLLLVAAAVIAHAQSLFAGL